MPKTSQEQGVTERFICGCSVPGSLFYLFLFSLVSCPAPF